MSPVQPLTTDWREWSRFMQNQGESITSLRDALNVGPIRELIPQIGPIRRTDTVATYQNIGANICTYIPFLVSSDFWDINGFYLNFDTTGGNYCLGIYNDARVRLMTTGSVASDQNAESVVVSPVYRLTRNRYYLGVAQDNGTATMTVFTGTPIGTDTYALSAAGVYSQGPAFPLPATATFSGVSTAYIPAVYIGIDAVA